MKSLNLIVTVCLPILFISTEHITASKSTISSVPLSYTNKILPPLVSNVSPSIYVSTFGLVSNFISISTLSLIKILNFNSNPSYESLISWEPILLISGFMNISEVTST